MNAKQIIEELEDDDEASVKSFAMPVSFRVGDRVKITSGGFTGCTGVIRRSVPGDPNNYYVHLDHWGPREEMSYGLHAMKLA